MTFEKFNLNQGSESPGNFSISEIPKKEIELSPAMRELYEEIVAEGADEGVLEREAKRMSAAERLGILGKAVERAGKLARRIAVVAFAAFSPSLAGSADSAKEVEKQLINETQTEWQKIKEKAEAKEGAIGEIEEAAAMGNVLSADDKLFYEQKFGLNAEKVDSIYQANTPKNEELPKETQTSANENERERSELTMKFFTEILGQKGGGVRVIPLGDEEILNAFKNGDFKTKNEFLKWDAERMARRYPEIVQKIKSDFSRNLNIKDASYFNSIMDEFGDKYSISMGGVVRLTDFIKSGLIK